jgi:hypothetical protein
MAPPFLASALDKGDWSASHPNHVTPGEEAPSTPSDRRLVGPQRWSGHCGVKKNFLPLPGIEPLPSSLQPVIIPNELPQLLYDYRTE